MKKFLKAFFLYNLPRKLLALLLAIVLWFFINQSLTSTKTFYGVPVRIENIPQGKTVEGMRDNGWLSRKINITLKGNQNLLKNISSHDIEIVLDGDREVDEWVATIDRSNLRTLNPAINLSQGITKLFSQSFIIKFTQIVTRKIPISVTKPIGEAPRGYELVDMWPYHLYLTAKGPQKELDQLAMQGLKLTFDLNQISSVQLAELEKRGSKQAMDTISFFIPDEWKQLHLPTLSKTPVTIDDPKAQHLRIDFQPHEMVKLDFPLPLSLYFPPSSSQELHPSKVALHATPLVEIKNGIPVIKETLFVKGVTPLFMEIIRERVELIVIVSPNEGGTLNWSRAFINAPELEEAYVSRIQAETPEEELKALSLQQQETYLRNRFRTYMNRFKLCTQNGKEFKIEATLRGRSVFVLPSQEKSEEEH